MNTRKGFTLVELLVVIAILAILATVSVVGYTSFIGQADKQAAETEAGQVETILDAGLTLNDYVKITHMNGENAEVVYVSVDEDGVYTVSTTATDATDANTHDATADTADLKGTLSWDDDKGLIYTVNEQEVVIKAAPADSEDGE